MKRYSIEKMCKVLQVVKEAIFNGKAGLFQIENNGLSLLGNNNLDLFRFKTKIWKSSNNGRTGFF
jgi:hypothetical protein